MGVTSDQETSIFYRNNTQIHKGDLKNVGKQLTQQMGSFAGLLLQEDSLDKRI